MSISLKEGIGLACSITYPGPFVLAASCAASAVEEVTGGQGIHGEETLLEASNAFQRVVTPALIAGAANWALQPTPRTKLTAQLSFGITLLGTSLHTHEVFSPDFNGLQDRFTATYATVFFVGLFIPLALAGNLIVFGFELMAFLSEIFNNSWNFKPFNTVFFDLISVGLTCLMLSFITPAVGLGLMTHAIIKLPHTQ